MAVPLAVGKIRGLRSFTIRQDGTLGPAMHNSYFTWEPGENTCYCDNNWMHSPLRWEGRSVYYPSANWYRARMEKENERNRICDDPTHGCGLWAYYDGTTYLARPWTTSGIVEGYGRCEIGPKGFRASRATLVAVVCRDRIMLLWYALIATFWAVCFLAPAGWLGMAVLSVNVLLAAGVFYLARDAWAGLSWTRLRKVRKHYGRNGVKVYSTRWLMKRRHPVDKVRSEWVGAGR